MPIMKLRRIGNSTLVALPQALLKTLGWKVGQRVTVNGKRKLIEIRRRG